MQRIKNVSIKYPRGLLNGLFAMNKIHKKIEGLSNISVVKIQRFSDKFQWFQSFFWIFSFSAPTLSRDCAAKAIYTNGSDRVGKAALMARRDWCASRKATELNMPFFLAWMRAVWPLASFASRFAPISISAAMFSR